jgi:RNA polymerase sigma-70 factor, ECF subfamily
MSQLRQTVSAQEAYAPDRAAYAARVEAQRAREQLERSVEAACRAGDFGAAVTRTIRGYGRELLAFLGALARDPVLAEEAFSQFCEDLWRGMPAFRWDSTLRTWCYTLARHARFRLAKRGGRAAPLSTSELEAIVAEVRTATASYLRSEVQRALAAAREALDDDDRLLLVLRVNRAMQWPEIVRIMADQPLERDEVLRRAVGLRKRFLRIKERLRVSINAGDAGGQGDEVDGEPPA